MQEKNLTCTGCGDPIVQQPLWREVDDPYEREPFCSEDCTDGHVAFVVDESRLYRVDGNDPAKLSEIEEDNAHEPLADDEREAIRSLDVGDWVFVRAVRVERVR